MRVCTMPDTCLCFKTSEKNSITLLIESKNSNELFYFNFRHLAIGILVYKISMLCASDREKKYKQNSQALITHSFIS